jgi:predicted MFS family arabinose efflux permease
MRIVPVVVGNAVGTLAAGRIIHSTKRYEPITAFGNAVGIVGFTLILLRWHGKMYWLETLYVALPGLAMGVLQCATFVHLAASLDRSETAIAATAWFLAQNIGVLTGASLSVPLVNAFIMMGLEHGLPGSDDKAEVSLNLSLA